MRDLLLILDGDHLASRMAARKLRAERICCRIVPWTADLNEIAKNDPSGIILCAASDTPELTVQPELLAFQGPVLALGAAAPALNAALGGSNGVFSPLAGLTEVAYSECPLLNGIETEARLLRGLIPMRLPQNAQVIATIGAERTAVGFSVSDQRRFGLQLELEAHDPESTRLLTNFAFTICGCTAWWDEEAFVRQATEDIRQAAGDGNAICLMTGGLYSNVTALLAARALGDRLTCVFIDTGLLQDDQEEWFFDFFHDRTGLDIIHEDHRDRFLQALKGVRDKAGKRMTIESMMTVIRRDVQRAVPRLNTVVRGRSFYERLTGGEEVTGLRAGVLCVEPMRDLFMEEARQIGRFLGMPEEILASQAIPATGLAMNVSGEVTAERLDLLRRADHIFRQQMENGNQTRRLSAYYAALEPGTTGYTVSLHALAASDVGMDRAARVPYDILENTMEQIRRECPRIIRVVYDLSPHMIV